MSVPISMSMLTESNQSDQLVDVRQIINNLKDLDSISSAFQHEINYKHSILSAGVRNNNRYLKSLHKLKNS